MDETIQNTIRTDNISDSVNQVESAITSELVSEVAECVMDMFTNELKINQERLRYYRTNPKKPGGW